MAPEKIKLWLVIHKERPYAAYPSESSAKVYATGFSDNMVEIVYGEFTALEAVKEVKP